MSNDRDKWPDSQDVSGTKDGVAHVAITGGGTVDGQGATFVFSPSTGVKLLGCKDLVLKNLSLDCVPKAFTQGVIRAVHHSGGPPAPPYNLSATIEVVLDDGYPLLAPAADWLHAQAIFWDGWSRNL